MAQDATAIKTVTESTVKVTTRAPDRDCIHLKVSGSRRCR
jgi:hypothetical protein